MPDKTIKSMINSYYSVALKYQFYDILKDFSYHLIKIFTIQGNGKLAKKESIRLKNYSMEDSNLILVKAIYFQTSGALINKSSVSKENMTLIKQQIHSLNDITKNSESFEIQFWSHYIKSQYYTLIKDTDALLLSIENLDKIFSTCKFYPPSREIAFVNFVP